MKSVRVAQYRHFLLTGAVVCSLLPFGALGREQQDYFATHEVYAETRCAGSVNQEAMSKCTNGEFGEADRKLNELYRTLSGRLQADNSTSPSNNRLKLSERTWIAYRDASCEFETSESADTPSHADYLNICKARYTRERISYLKWYIDNP